MNLPAPSARLRLPVRLKLAIVSAGLTFVILLLFAIVVGTFTGSAAELELRQRAARHRGRPPAGSTASRLRPRAHACPRTCSAPPRPAAPRSACSTASASDRLRPPLNGATSARRARDLRDVGGFRVASRPLLAGYRRRGGELPSPGSTAASPSRWATSQYAKPARSLDRHDRPGPPVPRLRRARRHRRWRSSPAWPWRAGRCARSPGLTAAAREVARTRDPATSLPKPTPTTRSPTWPHTLEDMLARARRGARARPRRALAASASSWPTPRTSCARR